MAVLSGQSIVDVLATVIGLARVNALNLVILGTLLMLACRRQWFGPDVPYWRGGIYSGAAFVGWVILRGRR